MRRRLPQGVLTVLLSAAVVLSACSLRKQYGVATHTDAVNGNCDTSRIVELGASLDLSGPQGALGAEYLTGLQMAVHHIDHSGGLLNNHSCLELLYKDDRGDPKVANQAVLDLVNNEVVNFLVGPFQSEQVQFTGENLGLSGIPNTSLSSLDQVRAPGSYPMTFPTEPSQATQASTMAAYARSRGWGSVAVAAVDDLAGREGLSALESDARANGYRVVGSVLVKPGAKSSAPVLAPLQADQPQALLVTGDTSDISQALVERARTGWDVPTLVPPVGADKAVIDAVGMSGLAGVSVVVPKAVVATPGAPPDPSLVSFLGRLQTTLRTRTLQGSVVPYAEAYDAVAMLGYAANSTNSTMAGNVRTFLENANYQGLLASYGYTSDRHAGVTTDQLTVVSLDSLSGGLLHTGS